jgi:pyridoxal phosphate enzyme (YggS family)
VAVNQPPPLDIVVARVAELRSHIHDRLVHDGPGFERYVSVVGVTKTFSADSWLIARDAGCDAVGENYAQEIVAKSAELDAAGVDPATLPPVHFIGHLQSNKVRQLYPLVALWQSVDRMSLLEALVREQDRLGQPAEILVQVNATREAGKSGCPVTEVAGLVEAAVSKGVVVRGLMTIGPTSEDRDETRSAFCAVAELSRSLGLGELSMGMSGDMDIALEEGATMLRIGTALFGQRPRSA